MRVPGALGRPAPSEGPSALQKRMRSRTETELALRFATVKRIDVTLLTPTFVVKVVPSAIRSVIWFPLTGLEQGSPVVEHRKIRRAFRHSEIGSGVVFGGAR